MGSPRRSSSARFNPLGTKRYGAKGSFVSTVIAALDAFYADVVENIRPWTRPAPQLLPPESIQLVAADILRTAVHAEPAPA